MGIVGANAHGVAIGHNANGTVTDSTTDAELIGIVIAALKAAGYTKEADTLPNTAMNSISYGQPQSSTPGRD